LSVLKAPRRARDLQTEENVERKRGDMFSRERPHLRKGRTAPGKKVRLTLMSKCRKRHHPQEKKNGPDLKKEHTKKGGSSGLGVCKNESPTPWGRREVQIWGSRRGRKQVIRLSVTAVRERGCEKKEVPEEEGRAVGSAK